MTHCQLYLISPLEVGGTFPDRLARALDAGPVAAFQFRVKGIDEHEAARLAEGTGWMPAIFKTEGPAGTPEEAQERDAPEDAEAMADEPAEALAA